MFVTMTGKTPTQSATRTPEIGNEFVEIQVDIFVRSILVHNLWENFAKSLWGSQIDISQLIEGGVVPFRHAVRSNESRGMTEFAF